MSWNGYHIGMNDQERRDKAKSEGPGTYGFLDMSSKEMIYYRVDSQGRVREMPDNRPPEDRLGVDAFLPPTWKRPPHIRHPIYTLGYEMAVSYEYQILLIDFFQQRFWPAQVLDLANTLVYPAQGQEMDSYEAHCRHWAGIAASVKTKLPELVDLVSPFLRRHGLDALPWGEGWLLSQLTALAHRTLAEAKEEIELEVKTATHQMGKRRTSDPSRYRPDENALLLYMHHAGVWTDKEARKIVDPVMPFADKSGMRERSLHWRVLQTKRELEARRGPGRPPGRSRYDRDDVYFALRSFVKYMS